MVIEQFSPLFEEGRVLKKEALERLRDYQADFGRVWFLNYGNGILEGFRIGQADGGIRIGPGILKDGDCIFIMKQEAILPFEADGRPVMAVLGRLTPQEAKDGRTDRYSMDIVEQRPLRGGEYELGRFRLEKGARLRCGDEYTDIRDAGTEYNTLNLIHVQSSCEGGSGLCAALLKRYARDVLRSSHAEPADLSFAMACLGSRTVPVWLLWEYLDLRCRDMAKPGGRDNLSCYQCLLALYAGLSKGNMGLSRQKGKTGKTLID